MATVKKIKKAQKGTKVKATPDSTEYYNWKADRMDKGTAQNIREGFGTTLDINRSLKLADDMRDSAFRQKFKGKPGYDANGFPVKKSSIKKKKSGGKVVAKSGVKLKAKKK